MLRRKFLVGGLVLLAVILRLLCLKGDDLWHPEALDVWLAQLPFPALLDTLKESSFRPPFYYWLLKVWGGISMQETWLRLFSLLLSSAAVWFTLRAGGRLFCRRTRLAVAALAAVSPLWVLSGGSALAPHGLDLFLGSLALLSFLRFLAAPSYLNSLFHGLVLTAGCYSNAAFLVLIPVEGLFLALGFKPFRDCLLKWSLAAGLALVLFSPWMPFASDQLSHRQAPEDFITQRLDLRVSGLITELSLGRLYAWYPLTPLISLTPAHLEDEAAAVRRPDILGDDPLADGLQALQMVFSGSFVMLALIGVFAALKISAWPLPNKLKQKAYAMNAVLRRVRGAPEPMVERLTPGRSVLLLLLYFLVPLGCSIVAQPLLGWTFAGSGILFVSPAFLILVARGIRALEWRVMFYSSLFLLVSLSAAFCFLSRGLEGLSLGTREAADFLEERLSGSMGRALVHQDLLTYFPLLHYSRGRLEEVSWIEGKADSPLAEEGIVRFNAFLEHEEALVGVDQVWRLVIEPLDESGYAGVGLDHGEEVQPIFLLENSEKWRKLGEQRFGNLLLVHYVRL